MVSAAADPPDGQPGLPGATRTVERALDLLDAVVAGPRDGSSLSQLARAAGLSPATASRLLGTLVARGLLRRGEQGEYRPGPALTAIAASVLRSDTLYELAGPHLEELARETGETANLGIAVDAGRALYLRQVPGGRLVQAGGWTGRTIPRRGTAMGGALAGEPGPHGYVVRSGALEPDVVAIAAPVHGPGGGIVAALTILAPSYRTGEQELERYGLLLVEHCAALSLALGAGGTGS